MAKDRIAIITGGDSSEKTVGLKTAAAVASAFRRMAIDFHVYEVEDFSQVFTIPIDEFTKVFIALHGGFGENGTLQSYLQGLNMPYNGPSPQSSGVCMDKLLTKHVARGLGILVPDFLFFRVAKDVSFDIVTDRLGSKFIVKPNGEGCSIGVTLIKDNFGDFDHAVELAASFNRGILVEEFIEGQELSVCFFYDRMLPIMGLAYEDSIFSWEAKYETDTTEKWFIELEDDVRAWVERDGLALASSLALDYYRNDVIIRDGKPYLIELNTLPGLTPQSLFPKACAQAGIDFDRMVGVMNGVGTSLPKLFPPSQRSP